MGTTVPPDPTYATRVDDYGVALTDGIWQQDWLTLLDQATVIDRLYATPQWATHQARTGTPVKVMSIFHANGSLAGLCSMRQGSFDLRFTLKQTALWTRKFRADRVMGMLLPSGDGACDHLFAALRRDGMSCSDCIYFETVSRDSNLLAYLRRSEEIRRNWICYAPNPFARSHYIQLPSSFDAYLKKFSSKSRGNLKREVRLLRERGAGALELVRVESAEQVAPFLESARAISRNSWQKKFLDMPITSHEPDTGERLLKDMATQGWLRSYVLKCGPKPCAFAFGYQARGVYHFCETAYDEAFAKLSPGKALVYLAIEDLIKVNKPDTFYFGQGDMSYKEWFGNAGKEDTNIVLFKNTMRQRAWWRNHRAFSWLLRSVRASARWLARAAHRGKRVS